MRPLARLAAVAAVFVLAATVSQAAGPFGGSVFKMLPGAEDGSPKYCATSRGLFAKKGGGWERVEPLGLYKVTAVAEGKGVLLAGIETKGLMASTDGGAKWSQVTEGLRSRYGKPVDEVTELAADREKEGFFYLGSAGKGFFVSQDYGKTWALKQEGLENATPASAYVSAILAPAKGRPLIMGTDGDGIFAMKGEKWSRVEGGLPKVLKVTGLAENPSDTRHLALSSSFEGLWESRDGGENWKPVYRGAYAVATAVSIGADSRLAAFFGQEGFGVFEEGQRPKVTNYGYAVVKSILPKTGGGFYAAFLNDGIRVTDSEGKIAGSDNAGLNGVTVRSFLDDADKKGLWVGDANGVFYSSDGSKTWEERDKGLITGDVTGFLWVDGKLYCGTAGQGVFLWDGEKREWIFRGKALGTSNTIYAMDKTADGKIYVATEGGILWTSDGGVNWTRASQTIPLARRMTVATDSKSPQRLWAANGTEVFETKDGGATWTSILKGDYQDVKFVGGSLWIMGNESVGKFNGSKVEAVFKGGGDRPMSFLPSGEVLYVGTDKGLTRVRGGKAEQLYKDGPVTAIHLDGSGRLLAGTDGRGVAVLKK